MSEHSDNAPPQRRRAQTAGDIELGRRNSIIDSDNLLDGDEDEDESLRSYSSSRRRLLLDTEEDNRDIATEPHDQASTNTATTTVLNFYYWYTDSDDDEEAESESSSPLSDSNPISRIGTQSQTETTEQLLLNHRQAAASRRRAATHCRFMRGFLVLLVYGFLVLQPSGPPPPELDDNLIFKLSQRPSNAKNQTKIPAVNKAAANLLRATTKANHGPPQQQKQQQRQRQATQKHQQQNTPQVMNFHRQHQHHRPKRILSHAHSFRYHQEPLVFGKEQNTSFFDPDDLSYAAGRSWFTQLIWLSLLSLILDTSYREWQQYRMYNRWNGQGLRRFTTTTSNNSSGRLVRRRYRTSPSPDRRARRRSQTNIF